MLDLTKPIARRDGKYPVRIICTNRVGSMYPPLLVLHLVNGYEMVFSHHIDGKIQPVNESAMDLVNVKTKKWQWAILSAAGYSYITIPVTEDDVKKYNGKIVGRILETEIEE